MKINKLNHLVFNFFIIVLITLSVQSCASTNDKVVVREITVQNTPEQTAVQSTLSINGETLTKIREDWQNEYIMAGGAAPVLSRYTDQNRNIGLAKRGALVDAQRNLAIQISETRLTESVIMRDLEVTDFVRTELNAVLRNVEVLVEKYNEETNMYEVSVRMPKLTLYSIIEEYYARN